MKQFDDIIQEKASGHEAPVPADAWRNIERKRRKRRIGFFWWTLCGLLLFGVATTVYISESKKSSLLTDINAPLNANSGDKVEKVNKVDEVNKLDEVNKVDEVNKADEVNKGNERVEKGTVNTNKDIANIDQKGKPVNSIQPTATDNQIVQQAPVSKKESTVLHKSRKQVVTNTDINPIVVNKKDKKKHVQKNNNDALASAKRPSRKTKAKTAVSVIDGETGNDLVKNDKLNDKTVEKVAPVDIVKKEADRKEELIVQNDKPLPKPPVVTPDSLKVTVKENNITQPIAGTKKKETEKTKKQKYNSWFVDLAVVPMLPVREIGQPVTLTRTIFANNNFAEFKSSDVQTSLDPAVAFSLDLKKKMGKRLMLAIGLQYLQLKENITIMGTEKITHSRIIDVLVNGVSGPELQQDTLYEVSQGERTIKGVNSYNLLSIPVFLQYDFIQKKKWSLGIVAGGAVNISSTYQNEINKNAAAPFLPVIAASETNTGFDIYGGLRFGRMIGKRVELFALPSVRWNLSGYKIKNGFFEQKIQQYGLGIGASFKLN